PVSGRVATPAHVEPPLTVLVIISEPDGPPKLDIDREWSNLASALADLEREDLVRLERLDRGALPRLHPRLWEEDVHVLHFIGHGAWDEGRHDGVLFFETETKQPDPVGGESLGMILHDHRDLQLVFLNACEGARGDGADPFTGTARRLLEKE